MTTADVPTEGQLKRSLHVSSSVQGGGAVVVEIPASLPVDNRGSVVDVSLLDDGEVGALGYQKRHSRLRFSIWPVCHWARGSQSQMSML